MYDIITIGGATHDIIFFTDQGILIDNKKEPTREKLLGFEYGAKIPIKNAYFTLGGGACNTAVAFSRLGLNVTPLIRIGNDKNGHVILDSLKKERLNSKFVQIDKKFPTGFSFIVATAKGKDHVAFLYRGANDKLQIPTNSYKFLQMTSPKWFYISSLTGKNWKNNLDKLYNCKSDSKPLSKSKFQPQFSASNIKISWNPGASQLKTGYRGLAKYLKKTDVLILNKDEATELVLSQRSKAKGQKPKVKSQRSMKNLLKAIYSWGPKIVAITYGAKGAYVYDGKEIYYSPAMKKKKVDTTGAGDAFGSSFVAGLILYKSNPQKALKLAIINSGSVVQQIGAQNGLLRKSELSKLNIREREV